MIVLEENLIKNTRQRFELNCFLPAGTREDSPHPVIFGFNFYSKLKTVQHWLAMKPKEAGAASISSLHVRSKIDVQGKSV